MSSPRYALYFTPPPRSPLARFGAAAVGYDCDEGQAVPMLALDGLDPASIAAATLEPSRYGFHATLAAPFRLAPCRTEAEILAALDAFADRRPKVSAGRLAPMPISNFIALTPCDPSLVLPALAADCLRAFHQFAAPLSADDRARRIAAGLTARQIALLDDWGYPYVLEEYRFHMTLAGPVPPHERQRWRSAHEHAFAKLADEPIVIDALSLLRQDGPEARFRVIRRQPFTG